MTTGNKTSYFMRRNTSRCGTETGTGVYQVWTQKQWSGVDKAVGENPLLDHPYSATITYADRGFCRETDTGLQDIMERCYGGCPPASSYTWSSNDELELLNKLNEKIRGHDFNAGVFAGTGLQTADLIGDSALRLANGYRALKKGFGTKAIVNALNGASGRSTGRGRSLPSLDEHRDVELSRRWLEAQYGWMPLLQDVHSAAQALAVHVANVHRVKFRVRSQRHQPQVTINMASGAPEGYFSGGLSNSYRQQLIFIADDERDLPSQFVQLGLTDPLSIIWELVPWSFAIDWFLPIGDMLAAAAMTPKLQGTFVRTITETRYSTRSVQPAQSGFETINQQKLMIKTVNRTIAGSLSVPLIPGFESPFSSSWKRTANQIALLAGLRSRSTLKPSGV